MTWPEGEGLITNRLSQQGDTEVVTLSAGYRARIREKNAIGRRLQNNSRFENRNCNDVIRRKFQEGDLKANRVNNFQQGGQ